MEDGDRRAILHPPFSILVFRLSPDRLQHDEDEQRQTESTAEQPDQERPARSGHGEHFGKHSQVSFPSGTAPNEWTSVQRVCLEIKRRQSLLMASLCHFTS